MINYLKPRLSRIQESYGQEIVDERRDGPHMDYIRFDLHKEN